LKCAATAAPRREFSRKKPDERQLRPLRDSKGLCELLLGVLKRRTDGINR
jgi:hypothetical protein